MWVFVMKKLDELLDDAEQLINRISDIIYISESKYKKKEKLFKKYPESEIKLIQWDLLSTVYNFLNNIKCSSDNTNIEEYCNENVSKIDIENLFYMNLMLDLQYVALNLASEKNSYLSEKLKEKIRQVYTEVSVECFRNIPKVHENMRKFFAIRNKGLGLGLSHEGFGASYIIENEIDKLDKFIDSIKTKVAKYEKSIGIKPFTEEDYNA